MSEEPVEILVQMAERGEIDPWNIDIVEVTDRFLAELERHCELDLRVSGRTLFYSSVLLRMKSEYLDTPQESEDEGEFRMRIRLQGMQIRFRRMRLLRAPLVRLSCWSVRLIAGLSARMHARGRLRCMS